MSDHDIDGAMDLGPLHDESTFPEQPSDEDLAEFKHEVSEWLKLDEQIKKLNIAVRERRVHQRALAAKVSAFMERYGYDNLVTQHGRIKASVRQVRQPLRVADLRAKILELGSDHVRPEEIVQRIFDADRPVVVKQSLRRFTPRVSLQLDI